MGKSQTYIYRQIYAGNIKVLPSFGRIRIPWTELDRLLGKAVIYKPKSRPDRKARREKPAPVSK